MHQRPHNAGAAKGFTLIELMTVVAIVAILVAIALPSYNESVRKGRRGQAKADLAELAQILERYHTINSTYVTDATFVNPVTQSPKNGTPTYNIAIEDQAANTFTVVATPVAGIDQANDRCGVLAIDQAGLKWHSIGDNDLCQFGEIGPP